MIALFKTNELNEPVAIVNPTSSFAKIFKDSMFFLYSSVIGGLTYTLLNISHEEEEDKKDL